MRVIPMCDATERHPATGCQVACYLERGHEGDHISRDLRWSATTQHERTEAPQGDN